MIGYRWLSLLLMVCSLTLSTNGSFMAVQAAEEQSSLEYLSIKEVNVMAKTDASLSGTFMIENASDDYFPELSVASELYLVQGEETNLVNKVFKKIEIGKKERKTMNFLHAFPGSLPSGNYKLMLRVYNRTGIPLGFKLQNLELAGTGIPFIIYDPEGTYLEKNGEKVEEASGPSFKPGESPKLAIAFRNVSSSPMATIPWVEVYKRSVTQNPVPVKSLSMSSLSFQGEEAKTAILNLPAMEIPDAYYARVFLKNDAGKAVSSVVEARYVIEGAGASITNLSSKIVNEKMIVSTELVGSADGSVQKNGAIKIDVYEENSDKPIATHTQELALTHAVYQYPTEIVLKDAVKNYKVSTQILVNDKVLDSTQVNYNVQTVKSGKTSEISEQEEQKADDKRASEEQGQAKQWLPSLIVGLATLVIILIAIAMFRMKKI